MDAQPCVFTGIDTQVDDMPAGFTVIGGQARWRGRPDRPGRGQPIREKLIVDDRRHSSSLPTRYEKAGASRERSRSALSVFRLAYGRASTAVRPVPEYHSRRRPWRVAFGHQVYRILFSKVVAAEFVQFTRVMPSVATKWPTSDWGPLHADPYR